MRRVETISLTVTQPKKQRIETHEAVVRWLRRRVFVVENMLKKAHLHARLQHYVKRSVRESVENVQ